MYFIGVDHHKQVSVMTLLDGEWNRRAQRVMRMRTYWVRKQTEVKNKIRALLAQQRPATAPRPTHLT